MTPQQGDTDRLTLEAQQAAVGVAQSNIAAQQALIRVLRQQKAYQSVVAPFDGIITQRNVDTGSLVQSGTTFMFTLMQSDVIRTQVYVPQDAAFGVAAGVDAVVRVPEIPDRTFPGKVTRFAHALAPGTRTLLTEIDIPNPDGALSPGMYVTVELHIPRKTPSIMVPADALVFNGDGVQVAVADNGTAHFHKVTVARDFGTEVEVRDGIKPGDEVILKPAVTLADGSKVQPQEACSPDLSAITILVLKHRRCPMRSLIFMTATMVLFRCSSSLRAGWIHGSAQCAGDEYDIADEPAERNSADWRHRCDPARRDTIQPGSLGPESQVVTIGTIMTCPTTGIAAAMPSTTLDASNAVGCDGNAASAASSGRNAISRFLLRHVNHDRRLQPNGSRSGRHRSFGQQRCFADTWSCYHHWTGI